MVLVLINYIARKKINPLLFWKEHEHESPLLSSVARDILSIPATGAGVERLFNSARDVCHYRRGSLNATTIQDIMMFQCTTRFDIETEEHAKEDLTLEAVQEADEKREAQLAMEEPEATSEGEDDTDDKDNNDPIIVIENELMTESQHPVSVNLNRKRQRSISSDSDNEATHPLPSYPDRGSTQRRAGLRKARRRRPDDPQWAYH